MEKRKLGSSDILVTPITIGCWSFGGEEGDYWGAQDQRAVERLVHAAIDSGADYFDTAYMYNDGRSESSLGAALKGKRNQAAICTKTPIWKTREQFMEELEKSLKRLGVDDVDVLMIHWPTRDEELMRANLTYLKEACEKGYVRHAGVSNFGVGTMGMAAEIGLSIIANEFAYSLMCRATEYEVAPYCIEHNIGITSYMSLMQGILTGKYSSIDEIPPRRRRTVHFDGEKNPMVNKAHKVPHSEAEVLDLVEKLKALAKEAELSPGQLALAWCLVKPAITTAIVGCRDEAQLYDNIKAGEAKLDAGIIAALDEASQPILDKIGNIVDIFGNDRIW
ncbi:MAG: aldo/keto reductase [Oscillospiraceae bacterium]|nr:aldo/keto reductase [Oscillospiraceae bacterium]